MNINKLLIELAEVLIDSNGTTTTLEVKNEFRKLYPTVNITQFDVSNCLINWEEDNPEYSFTDNGMYRTYYKCGKNTSSIPTATVVPNPTQSNPPKIYSVTLSNGVIVQGTKEQVIDSARALTGQLLHFSQNKNQFELIEDMHPNHVLNVIWNEIEYCTTPQKFVDYIRNNPYVNQLLNTL